MGVKMQRPGDPGHPGGSRRIYVRINYQGHRKTRVFNSSKAAETVEYLLKHGKPEELFTEPTAASAPPAPTLREAVDRWLAVDGASLKPGSRDEYQGILKRHIQPAFGEHPCPASPGLTWRTGGPAFGPKGCRVSG